MNKTKKIIFGSIIGVLIGVLVSTTYAVFSYTATSNNQQLVTGDIYMYYKESNSMMLENALPTTTYDSTKYFEFTIDGKNTNTLYDIYYDIILNRGDVPTGKVEANRIQDKFIKFRLTEFINNVETEIFTNKSYNDLTNKRIHVATIPKNTTSEIIHRYRLYMWISNSVVIGNTGTPGIDYDLTSWNNLFASVKVGSTGDFTEKTLGLTMADMCPNCKFMYTTNELYTTWNMAGYDDINDEPIPNTPTVLTSNDYSNNYQDVVTASGKSYFLGVVLNGSNQITRAFSCGIANGSPFCIEGTADGSKYSNNESILYETFGEYDENTDLGCSTYNNGSNVDCNGPVNATAGGDGYVNVVDDAGHCYVNPDGEFACFDLSGGLQ